MVHFTSAGTPPGWQAAASSYKKSLGCYKGKTFSETEYEDVRQMLEDPNNSLLKSEYERLETRRNDSLVGFGLIDLWLSAFSILLEKKAPLFASVSAHRQHPIEVTFGIRTIQDYLSEDEYRSIIACAPPTIQTVASLRLALQC